MANCFLSVYEESIFNYLSGFNIVLKYLYIEQRGVVFTVSSRPWRRVSVTRCL